jgi:hypothetical protein
VFHHALANAGFTIRQQVALTHTTGADGPATVTAPLPADGNNSLLIVHDSTGGVSWHLPQQLPPAAAKFRAAAEPGPAGASEEGIAAPATGLSFEIPAHRFSPHLLGELADHLHHFSFHPGLKGAKKLLTFVEYPVEHLVSWSAKEWITDWDLRKHPNVIRWFPPTGGQTRGEPLSPTNWADLDRSKGRVLLFIHGIFSSSDGAFGAITDDARTSALLHNAYQGRIIGFDHRTVSIGPGDNAEEFLRYIPQGITLDVDIICHSRGGLVARALAGQTGLPKELTDRIDVKRVVFAATPNGGSEIANPDNWTAIIDRISSLLTMIDKFTPPTVDAVTTILAGILEIVKIVGVGVAADLPGLEDMQPDAEFLKALGSFTGAVPEYFAAASDFTPPPPLQHIFSKLDNEGRVVDIAVFHGAHNDIAVPTNGVWDPANPDGDAPGAPVAGFPVPDDPQHRLAIGPGDVYWHSAYFRDPDLRAALVTWLTPPT